MNPMVTSHPFSADLKTRRSALIADLKTARTPTENRSVLMRYAGDREINAWAARQRKARNGPLVILSVTATMFWGTITLTHALFVSGTGPSHSVGYVLASVTAGLLWWLLWSPSARVAALLASSIPNPLMSARSALRVFDGPVALPSELVILGRRLRDMSEDAINAIPNRIEQELGTADRDALLALGDTLLRAQKNYRHAPFAELRLDGEDSEMLSRVNEVMSTQRAILLPKASSVPA